MNKNSIHKITSSERLTSAMMRVTKLAFAAAILFGYNAAVAETSSNATENNMSVVDQQTKRITGTVVDQAGAPLLGITVSIDGTTKAVMTDANGIYLIDAPVGAVLNFSFIGMKSVSQTVGSASEINVTMQEDALDIDAAIVVGYGTTSTRKISSAVSSVNAKQLVNLPVSNITQGLAGRAAGLIVTQSGGGLGNTTKVSIRGGATPLVSINGIISSYNDFVNINPDDIASFSILKDAAATAIYGSRAGDGIIVIKTKQGKGKATIDYSFNYVLSEVANDMNKLNSFELANTSNDVRSMYGRPAKYTPEQVRKYGDGSDPYNYPNTDWYGEVLRDFAPEERHNLTIQGGDDKNSYFFSFGMYNQQSLIKSNTNWLDRYNYRLSTSSLIETLGLRVSPSISGYIETTNTPRSISSSVEGVADSYYYIFGHMQNASPMGLAYNQYGQPISDFDNPIVESSQESGYSRKNKTVVNGQLDLEWSRPEIPGLTLRASGNYNLELNDLKAWEKTARVYDLDGNPLAERAKNLSKSFTKSQRYTLQYFVDYQTTIAEKNHLSLTAGYEASYGWGSDLWGRRRNFIIDMDQMKAGDSATQENSAGESESGNAGWIGRLQYDYDSKYFVEGTIRYDGNDQFPVDKRWGLFYSVSASWNVSSENFWEVIKEKHIFDFFKIRASYGQTGQLGPQDGNGNPIRWSYQSAYGFDERGYVYDGKFFPTFWEGGLPSPDITWYTQNTLDIGVDFESLGGRLKGSFDYYYMETNGFLASPSNTSFTDPLGINLPTVMSNGQKRRGGFEASLSWAETRGDFYYSVGANLTYFDELNSRNWTEDFNTIKNPYKRWTQRTGAYGAAYINQGYYADASDVMNTPTREGSSNMTAGDIKYLDFNGDGKLDGDDQPIIGSSGNKPRMTYGITGEFSWKGIFLNFLIQGSSDRDIYMGDRMQSNPGEGGQIFTYSFQQDYWTPTNTNAKYPRPVESAGENGNNNYQNSDFWLVNARYIRLKNVQIGYDFKQGVLKNSKWLSKLQLSLSGQNLLTFSPSLKYGFDPENGSTNNYYYPVTKAYSLTLNIGF